MSTSLRIIFAGTSHFSVRHLDGLLCSEHQVVGVFTQPDRPSYRGQKIMPTPVKAFAKKYGLFVFQPISLHDKEYQKKISLLNADIMVVVSYGLILPKSILEIPRFGCINVHASLLPRWRGAAPIQRSILAGDTETGITIIKMDVGLDTGDILYKLVCPINNDDTSQTLCKKLAELGTYGLIKTLRHFSNKNVKLEKQSNIHVTYAQKIKKEEGQLNWSLSSIQLMRCIRAFNPWPSSWIKINNQIIKIWKASIIVKTKKYAKPGTIVDVNKHGIQVSTSDGILNLELLQISGKKIVSAQDILNSHYTWFTPGKCLI